MKILILGLSCSGKTTFSNHLAEIFNIPCYHLDSYFWKSCWIKNDNFNIKDIINLPEWIIDGNYYKEEFKRRLDESNLIIYLNNFLIIRLYRMIKRHLRYKKNPERYDAVSNKINLKFIISTIKKQMFVQPKLIRYLNNNYKEKLIYKKGTNKLINIKNEEDIYKLLNTN